MQKHRLSRRTVIGLMGGAGVMLTAGARADAPDAGDATISGAVVYSERMMLPQGSEVEIELADVSLADAPATVLARTTVRDAAASPVPFTLRYDPELLRDGHSYALQARITHENRLLFINDERHDYQAGAGRVEIAVRRVAVNEDAAELSVYGSWLAEDIDGGGVIDNAQTTLVLSQDGAVSGRGACNGYGGTATIDGDAIAFSQLVSTQMACPEAVMNQEMKFFDALGRVERFEIDADQRKLVLLDGEGKSVVRLAAM